MSKKQNDNDTPNDSGDFERLVKNLFAVPPEELEAEIEKDRQAGLPVPEQPDPKDTQSGSENSN